MQVLANAGVMALASMFVGVLPLATAILYVIWPTEQRLTAIRTLSLATVFGAISGTTLGFLNELRYMDRTGTLTFNHIVAIGLAESLVPVFFGFGCLTVTWLCVTLGMWRERGRE